MILKKYLMLPNVQHKNAFSLRSREQGVVLLIALIVLVAMTLAGVAMIRSTSTTNLIAGNLAFHQAATSAGDIGAEKALDFLKTAGIGLSTSKPTKGYSAVAIDPNIGESWDTFWIRMETAGKTFPDRGSAGDAIKDSAGNKIFYMVHRLCDNEGTANTESVRCIRPPKLSTDDSSKDSGIELIVVPQVYYRITVRVEGPRNTLSYIQTIVAI